MEVGPAARAPGAAAREPAPEELTLRVAMWSGPRTLSTTLMRAWGARPDTVVVDEPLYAFYLARTGLDHPGREDILATQPAAWPTVLEQLVDGPLPPGARISYQKHMTHHLLPEVDRSRLDGLHHAFLLRHPAAVAASYARVRRRPSVEDLGLPQQIELHRRFGGPIVDADDLLGDPPGILEALCRSLGVSWDPAMLRWPAGRQPSDGVWGPHWYASVWASTGFGPLPATRAEPPADLAPLVEDCLPLYEELWSQRLVVG